uniref:Matrin 3-like 1.1 n=1 Tax=Nothobranchius korthausae TaxID=1143690 RepID=A0A1A8HKE0_9TELE
MAAAEPKKRRKFDINFKEKVLEYAAEHSGEQAAKHFSIDPKRIRYWKKQRMDLAAANKRRARLPGGGRKKVSTELDTKLSDWIHSMRDKHNRVSRRIIRNKAVEIYPTVSDGGEQFLASRGWLQKFLIRNGFALRRCTVAQKDPDLTGTVKRWSDARIKSEPEDVPVTEEQMYIDEGLSADDSDIEGMEVIAEDGEDVNYEDVEIEEEEKTNSSKERENSLGQDEEGVKGMKTEEAEEAVVVKEEEAKHTEPGQEKCGEEGKTSEVKEEEKEEEEASDLQKDEVLVEMSTPAESQRADEVLPSKPVLTSNSRTSSGSTSGSEPPHHHLLPSFPSSTSLICHLTEDTAHSHSKNRGLKKSDASDQDRTCSREGEESLRKTLEKKTDETSEMETAENISKIDSKSKTTEDQELKTTSEKELVRTGHTIDSQEAEQSEEPSSDTKMKTETSQPEPQQNTDMDQQSAPGNSPPEPKKPATPVGAEFVRPVVGYFCNLCQLIFSDEDEAKLLHCSTPEHYRKYQEKTGKNPWMN